jgi:hypothetical protein
MGLNHIAELAGSFVGIESKVKEDGFAPLLDYELGRRFYFDGLENEVVR